jgi:hypothetical protein
VRGQLGQRFGESLWLTGLQDGRVVAHEFRGLLRLRLHQPVEWLEEQNGLDQLAEHEPQRIPPREVRHLVRQDGLALALRRVGRSAGGDHDLPPSIATGEASVDDRVKRTTRRQPAREQKRRSSRSRSGPERISMRGPTAVRKRAWAIDDAEEEEERDDAPNRERESGEQRRGAGRVLSLRTDVKRLRLHDVRRDTLEHTPIELDAGRARLGG